MSQFYVGVTAGSLPPTVPTSFVTDSGTAVPAANVINVNGAQGITTSGSGNTIVITLTENTITGSVTTTDSTPTNLITYTPTDNKAFSLQGLITGYDLANNVAIGGEIIVVGRKNGGVVAIVSPQSNTVISDPTLSQATFNAGSNGTGFRVTVIGVAGHTIAWSGILNINQSP